MTQETLKIRLDVDGQGRVRASLDNVSGQLDKTGRTGERASRGLITFQRVLATVGAGFTLRHVLDELGGFEQSLSGVRAVTQASDAQMQALQAQARELGATTLHSGQQAAEGMRFLGQAGFDTHQIIAAMPSTLALATAANMDLSRSADIASNVLQAFRMEASEMPRVADTLAAAASTTNTNVQQLGEGMQHVGPVAAALRIDVAETAAALGALSDAGIQGSAAGTGLRRILSSLVNPTTAAKRSLAEMGVTMEEVDPRANSLSEIMHRLQEAGLEADQAFQIFGQRGGPAILELVNQSAKLGELTEQFRDSEGRAREMADTMADNIPGALRAMSSAMSENIQQLGDAGLSGAFRGVIERGTAFLRVTAGMEEHLTEQQQGFRATILVADNLGTIFSAVAVIGLARLTPALISVGGSALTAARGMTTAAGAARGLRTVLAFLGGPAGLLIGGAAALGMWAFSTRDAAAASEDYEAALRGVSQQLDEIGTKQLEQAIRDQQRQIQALREEASTPLQDSGTSELIGFLSGDEDAVIDVEARQESSRENLAAATDRLADMEAELASRKEGGTRKTEENTVVTERNNDARTSGADEIRRYIENLDEEIATLGMSQAEQIAWRGEQMAGTAATEEQADAIRIRTATLIASMAVQDEVTERERVLDEMRSNAQSTLRSLMTDEERHLQTRQQLQAAFDAGLLDIDEAEFHAQMKRLEESFGDTTDQMSQYAKQGQRNIQNTLGNSLEQMMRGNFDNILDMWIDMIIRMEAQAMASRILGQDSGSGGFFSAIAGMFGGGDSAEADVDGGSALGGSVRRGSLREVNEQGPEMLSVGGRDFLMMSGQDGRITPNHQLAGGGGNSVAFGDTVINAQGNQDPAMLMQLEQRLAEERRRMLMQVKDMMDGRVPG